MKRMKRNLVTMAVASAGLASAESMKADVPFSFHASGARLLPGSYEVTLTSNNALRIYNADEHKAILALPSAGAAPSHSQPVLVFACSNGACELAGLKGFGSMDYSFPRAKSGPETRMAEVALRTDRGE